MIAELRGEREGISRADFLFAVYAKKCHNMYNRSKLIVLGFFLLLMV
jgi:hypothetical protein